MAKKAELGILALFFIGVPVGIYYNNKIVQQSNQGTCFHDSRKESGTFTCNVVDDGKTLPFSIQLEAYGATKEDAMKAFSIALNKSDGGKTLGTIIGADLNKYGYKMNAFINVPKPTSAEPPALPIPEAKKNQKKKK